MRTALFLPAAFLLLTASLLQEKLLSANYPGVRLVATIAYIALWMAIAAANMWIGVAKAGYSTAEEALIMH